MSLAFWTIAAGILSGASCSLLGCYLVLRRMSLLGDAISHAVLPGTVVAVFWSGQLSGWQVFAGAVLAGLLTAFLTQALSSLGNIPEDSSMGVVYTSLFALGVILIMQLVSDKVDLDPGCVLYGQIEMLPLARFKWWGLEIPWEILPLAAVTVVTAVFVGVFWKELKLVAFDAALATAMGISAVAVHYLLMSMVAVVTVASFKSVGSILVIAMLIVPPATAHLLTDRLLTMQAWAVVCAIISAIVGFQLALQWNTSVAGMMSVVSGALFFLAVIFAPQHGLVTQAVRTVRLTLRIVSEDILAVLYRVEERGERDGRATTLNAADCMKFTGGGVWPKLAMPLLKSRGLVENTGAGQLALTEMGRRKAQSLVRSHRLWESYLEKHFEIPRDHLHAPASRIEHYLGPTLQQELSQELATPAQDPHGQNIPPVEPKSPKGTFDQFKCLSFDCYGTLIDWETGLLTSLRGILQAHNVAVDDQTLLEIFGDSEAEIQAQSFRPYQQVLREVLSKIGEKLEFRPSILELDAFATSVKDWPPFADTIPALKRLGTRFQIIILSNIDDSLFQYTRQQLGIEFAHVFTAQTIGSYKPSIRNFRYLIDHAGVAPHQILHVAQSLFHDIAPAKEIGLATVWVDRRAGRAGSGATRPAQATPDWTVPDLQSLVDLIFA